MTEAFRHAIEQAGLTPPPIIIPDGKLHRFPSNGDQGDSAGWYCLHNDAVPVGVFGCWRLGITQKWCGKAEDTLTKQERAACKKRLNTIQQQREKEDRRRHAEAQAFAVHVWANQTEPVHDNQYLLTKQVQAYGVRQLRSTEATDPLSRWGGSLVIPMRDVEGTLWSLEFIHGFPDGRNEKHFLSGGKKKANFHLIGTMTDVLLVAEGYATGASVHEATGYVVAVAFDAGNLLSVAKALRARHADVTILLCGDHDKSGVGQAKATEAAAAVNGLIAIPDTEGMDWNDIHVKYGLEAVKQAIDAVLRSKEHTLTPAANTAFVHSPPVLAQEPNILAKFKDAIQACGVVGEETCACILFLALSSRVLQEPVSVVVKGLSSSGKSFTTETVLRFFPETAYVRITAMSERALIYSKEEYAHRTLIIIEAVALKEQREKQDNNLTAYFIRSLLSEGQISYPVVVIGQDGGFYTKTITKKGPTNAIITTTSTELHSENETRLLSIPTNDTTQQTKAVMLQTAVGPVHGGDVQDWQVFQAWLATAEHRVVIPYARYLADNIPPVAVRLRRDFKAFLRLIQTHAIVHQCTRGRDDDGRIVATKDDYHAIRALIADLVSAGVGATVPQTMRETVRAVQTLADKNGISSQAVATALKLDQSAAYRRLQAARHRGYIVNLEDKRGRPGRYVVGEPLPDEQDLFPREVPDTATAFVHGDDTRVHSPSASDSEPFPVRMQACSDSCGGQAGPDDPDRIQLRDLSSAQVQQIKDRYGFSDAVLKALATGEGSEDVWEQFWNGRS